MIQHSVDIIDLEYVCTSTKAAKVHDLEEKHLI